MAARSKPDTERLLSLLFEMGRMIRHACMMAGDLPLPLAHLETLRFVHAAKEDPTMREIAEYLRVSAPSATQIIDDLAKQKLLVRKNDAHDRRMVRLALSSKGTTLLSKNMLLRMKVLRGLVGNLSAADEREFIRILSQLVKI